MKSKFSFARVALVLASTLVLGGQAFAQSIMYTPVQTQTFTGLGGTSTATPLSFYSFNSALGTLTSVQIILQNVTLSGSAFGTNTANSSTPPGDTIGNEDILLNLRGTLTVTSAAGFNVVLNAVDTADNAQNEVVPGASTSTFTYTDVPGSPSSNTQTKTSGLTSYEGNGSTTVTVNVTPTHFGVQGQAYASASSSANYISANYNGGATASGEVQVIYYYAPVPEPAETAMWMLGFVLVVGFGRKYLRRQEPAMQAIS